MTHALVAGGAGFLGSHLVDRLLDERWQVTVVDNELTGDRANLGGGPARFIKANVALLEPSDFADTFDWVFHLASPASPKDYLAHPIETLMAGSRGTSALLEIALDQGVSFVLASTSEVYGSPLVHPQPEGYWGNVNPIGPRSVYDEAKRFSEALTMSYHRQFGLPTRIARIFNTVGPRMRADDGRAVPTFIRQALAGEDVTVQGSGRQTRSLCYVDDLVEGLYRMTQAQAPPGSVINLGNDEEITVWDLADKIITMVGGPSSIVNVPAAEDDPHQRRPDLALARRVLGYEPRVGLDEGLQRTIDWAQEEWL